MPTRIPVCLIALLAIASNVGADDWPRFLGPNATGVVQSEKDIARQWPGQGPRVHWTIAVGEGFGGPAIRDGNVYLLDREDDAKDVIRCIDLVTGEEAWRFEYEQRGRLPYNGTRGTPTVTDRYVYTVGPFGDVYCIDLETRKPKWHVELSDFGGETPRWGFGQSPLIYKNMLIVAPLADDAGIAALNLETGATIWKAPDSGTNSYGSPKLVTIDGHDQILLVTTDQLTSVDPANGRILWVFDELNVRQPIPDPTFIGPNRLFVTGGYDMGSYVIEVGKTAAGQWKVSREAHHPYGSHLHSALLIDGHLYANLNTNENLRGGGRRRFGGRPQPPVDPNAPKGLACLNLKGEAVWNTANKPDINRGNLICVNGVLISMGGEDGVLRLIEATPKGYKEMASAKMLETQGPADNHIWAPMAFADGKLIIRSQSQMKCVDLANP